MVKQIAREGPQKKKLGFGHGQLKSVFATTRLAYGSVRRMRRCEPYARAYGDLIGDRSLMNTRVGAEGRYTSALLCAHARENDLGQHNYKKDKFHYNS